MKNFLLFTFFLISTVLGYSQAVSINTDGSPANGSAILDVKSDNKGFLPPRLTTQQRDAIVAPADGLQIYNIDIKQPQYFNGTCWLNFGSNLAIGSIYAGGIIFYLDSTGCHGLVCSFSDQSRNAQWGCLNTDTGVPNVTNDPPLGLGAGIGDGVANTAAIIAAGCAGSGAAAICDELVLNGYDDWFLPSLGELNLMIKLAGFIGLSTNSYYSSTEIDDSDAWLQDIYGQFYGIKSNYAHVRAIRAF